MTNWEDDEEGYCTAAQDFQDAQSVAKELGIALHRVSFAQEYRERVFAHFLAEYQAGRTPNPDVLCNREVKFGACLAYAQRLGLTQVATGHYARLQADPAGMQLHRAWDASKDQSYFLHQVSSESLAHGLFPLGELPKTEVRDIARSAGLPVHDKRDSTGICFIGERPFRRFLQQFLPAQPGHIETLEGDVVGTHNGLMYYTIGQRRGIELGGIAGKAESAWYVVGKDLKRNALTVVQGHAHPALYSDELRTEAPHWIGAPPSDPVLHCSIKVRYRQQDVGAIVRVATGGGLHIRLSEPTYAVTLGQYAVLYDGSRCLGGAVISATQPAPGLASGTDNGQ